MLKAVIDTGVSDLPPEVVALASGFGGGIGLSGNNCGALNGAVMAVGAVHGRKNSMEKAFKERLDQLYGNPGLYRLFNNLPHQFQECFGSIDCVEINRDYSDWLDRLRRKNCMQITAETAGMAMVFILKGADKVFCQPFGDNIVGAMPPRTDHRAGPLMDLTIRGWTLR